MKDLEQVNHFGLSEKLVKVLNKKTGNSDKLFYRVLVAFYFAKVASMMRVKIKTHDRGEIPVNMYAVNLATSGFGKGHSTNILEEQVIDQFRENFLEQTFPSIAQTQLAKIAVKRAAKKGCDPDEELEKVNKEFDNLGNLLFSFDSGTSPALKQMRYKLLMADAGSVNLHIDEIGSNLVSNEEILNTYLELFDVGKVKQKLVKNTAENQRGEDIDGRTPTNMLLFGTPAKLLDGGKTEEAFYSMLETGYARRCFFGFARPSNENLVLTPEQIYANLTDTSLDNFTQDLSQRMGILADETNFGKTLLMSKDVSITLIRYKQLCEQKAAEYPEHEEIRKAELSHRYFKALKLAGAYTFIEGNAEITEDILWSAIKLTEESGAAFDGLLTRDRNYVKLAKYIASINREITHVDLVEDLPFYKGSNAAKHELMNLAMAYGYKNNIIIKKTYSDGIEFFKGDSIKETDLNKMVLSHSSDWTHGYKGEYAPFDKLHSLTQLPNHHWVNHHLVEGHRKEENANTKVGFNMVVLDVEKSVDIETAKLLLSGHKYLLHTTKRHTDAENRYRILLPLSHHLNMSASEYKDFMSNIYEWLPFEVDDATGQRARKWATHAGDYFYGEGECLYALQFIPKTSKNAQRKEEAAKYLDMGRAESWFAKRMSEGNRSNELIKYALMLVDNNKSASEVEDAVIALNDKLNEPLAESEIRNTILVTAAKRMVENSSP